MEDFSSGDEDWEDELPLATIRELDRVKSVIRAQGGEDSDGDGEGGGDGDGFNRCPSPTLTCYLGQHHESPVKKTTTRLQQMPLPHPDMLSGSASQKSGQKTKTRLQQVPLPHPDMISMSAVTCQTCHIMSRHIVMSYQVVMSCQSRHVQD